MWITHNRALISFAEAHPEDVLGVSFDKLRGNFPLVEALNWYWGLALAETPTSEVFDRETPSGPRSRQIVSDGRLIGEALETWEALERLRRRTGELVGWPTGAGEQPTEGAFYKPTDAYGSEIKNQFTGFEMRLLRSRLEETRGRLEELQNEAASMVPARRARDQQDAETDLKLILKRISGSKAAPIFRLKGEFRELENKYLG